MCEAFTDDPQEAKKNPFEESVGLIKKYAQEHGFAKEQLPKNKDLVPVVLGACTVPVQL